MLKNNEGTVGGGGAYLQDKFTRLSVSGNKTRMTVEHNIAVDTGGGFQVVSQAQVFVESGAVLELRNNTAHWGGGVSLENGAMIMATGKLTQMMFVSNTAVQGGVANSRRWRDSPGHAYSPLASGILTAQACARECAPVHGEIL